MRSHGTWFSAPPVVHGFMDVTVIGAGPAGLQWGLLLSQLNLSYVILEAQSRPAPFFRTYPRSRRLISHNRCNFKADVATDFALRHDWHTLLHAPNTFCDFAKKHDAANDFYPRADTYVSYLEDVAKDLNIRYMWNASSVSYDAEGATVCSDAGECLRSEHVVLATGMRQRKSSFASLDYSTFPELDSKTREAEFCRGKRIGIIGGGNAALETANMLASCAQSVHVYTPRPVSFAALSHYPGNLRMQHMALFDRYMLKTLDTMEVVSSEMAQMGCYNTTDCSRGNIDAFIYCGGFTGARAPLVTDMSERTKRRFPHTDPFYKVRDSFSRGWYSGVLMHGDDYKLSSGGFVHGFRYLIRSQARFLTLEQTGVWEGALRGSKEQMQTKAVRRMQTSSGLYQMQHVLGDFILFLDDDAFVYLEEIPYPSRHAVLEQYKAAKYCAFLFAYDVNAAEKAPFDFEKAVADVYVGQSPPRFLHPTVVSESGSIWEGNEDVHGTWTSRYSVETMTELVAKCLAR